MLTIGRAKKPGESRSSCNIWKMLAILLPSFRVQAALLEARISERAPERDQPAVLSPFVGRTGDADTCRSPEMCGRRRFSARRGDMRDRDRQDAPGDRDSPPPRCRKACVLSASPRGRRTSTTRWARASTSCAVLAPPGSARMFPASMRALERSTRHDPASAEDRSRRCSRAKWSRRRSRGDRGPHRRDCVGKPLAVVARRRAVAGRDAARHYRHADVGAGAKAAAGVDDKPGALAVQDLSGSPRRGEAARTAGASRGRSHVVTRRAVRIPTSAIRVRG